MVYDTNTESCKYELSSMGCPLESTESVEWYPPGDRASAVVGMEGGRHPSDGSQSDQTSYQSLAGQHQRQKHQCPCSEWTHNRQPATPSPRRYHHAGTFHKRLVGFNPFIFYACFELKNIGYQISHVDTPFTC